LIYTNSKTEGYLAKLHELVCVYFFVTQISICLLNYLRDSIATFRNFCFLGAASGGKQEHLSGSILKTLKPEQESFNL